MKKKYKVIKEELKASWDVDENILKAEPTAGRVEKSIELSYYGQKRIRYPHTRMIELVKAHKKRGFYITIHSANGFAWAEEAIIKLELEDYVDAICTKDQVTFDDKPDCGIPVVWVEDV